MKTILLSLIVLFSLNATAQTDSSQLRSGKLSLRMNDWEYVTTFMSYNPLYENVFDSIKNRIRPLTNAQYPAGTTLVTVDSVQNSELVAMCLVIRNEFNSQTQAAIIRITTAVRALNNTWINNQLDAIDASESAAFINRRTDGKFKLRRR